MSGKAGGGGRSGKHAKTMKHLEGQSFQEIRDRCVSQGTLWEDPDFPATDASVFPSQDRSFEWKRPHEFCENPRMFVGGASRFDIQQGDLGNCWFLAATGSLCLNKQLLHRVVPKDNSFVEKYGGIVHFQIWQYGRWVDICLDDRLPTVHGRLAFVHSPDNNEFWAALLEKAYAKLNGSYEALRGGNESEAMEDFTGGVSECFDLRKDRPKNLFQIMLKAFERDSLMGCSIEAAAGSIESILANGLVIGHAYSITNVKLLEVRGRKVQLVRIRNPWGNQHEWKGPWGDGSPEWKMLTADQRKTMGLTFDDDGEFWMAFDDFVENYHKVEVCNLGPDALAEDPSGNKKRWEMSIEEGSWVRRVNAGGCRNYLDTFWTNPQYHVEVEDPDEDDDEALGSVVVALLQKEHRKKGKALLTIGYSIYQLPDQSNGDSPLDMEFFKYNRSAGGAPSFSNVREICGRHRLLPGHYCIIPCTFEPGQEGDFLLRIFTEKPFKTKELDEETGIHEEADQDDNTSDDTGATKLRDEEKKRRQRVRGVTDDDVEQEKVVRDLFKETAGEDMEVDAFELRDILNRTFMSEFRFDGFSLDTCRSIVAVKDLDKSGKLGYDEFKKMWAGLRMWAKCFREFDKTKTGTFNSFELREALKSAGYYVSNSTFRSLVMRYSDKDGQIFFDDFIQCAVRIRTMYEVFKEMSDDGRRAEFTLDQFIQTTVYS